MKPFYPRVLVLILSGFVFFSCDVNENDIKSEEKSQEKNKIEDVKSPEKEEEEKMPLFISYQLDSISTAAEVDSFKNKYSQLQQDFILALNRMDARQLKKGKQLVIPDTLTQNFLDYSPFPQNFEMISDIPKAVIISRRVQGFALYKNGNLVRWGPVSSGKKSTPTPAGLFYGNYKARSKVSTVDESWILPYYFNFMNFEGVGVHQYAMPGYPASHACVRLMEEDAKAIYQWAEQWELDQSRRQIKRNGTPFMVFGNYDFEKTPPWFKLAKNPQSNFFTSEEMDTLRKYVNDYEQDKLNFESSSQISE